MKSKRIRNFPSKSNNVSIVNRQNSHLTSAKEYLRVSKSVFILVGDVVLNNVCARHPFVIAALAQFAQQKVATVEILIRPSRWKTSRRNANGFQNTTGSQLLHDLLAFPFESDFVIVGLQEIQDVILIAINAKVNNLRTKKS